MNTAALKRLRAEVETENLQPDDRLELLERIAFPIGESARTVTRGLSAGGWRLNPTPDEMAAIQEAVSDAYDAWADSVEVEVLDGEKPADAGVWPEVAHASDDQLSDLGKRLRDAVAGPTG